MIPRKSLEVGQNANYFIVWQPPALCAASKACPLSKRLYRHCLFQCDTNSLSHQLSSYTQRSGRQSFAQVCECAFSKQRTRTQNH